MSKPQPVSSRPDEANEADDLSDEIEVIRERDKVYPQQRDAAGPADEVLKRLLDRSPAP